MSQIPTASRAKVKQRAHGRCERCGVPAPNGEWHHRRSRSVHDEHQHCPCNGAWLCSTCHRWAHAHPVEARNTGFIVSRHIDDPGIVIAHTPWGARWNTCTGGVQYL